MNDTRLFIAGKEVEFSADPKILFNYKGTELSNPTIVRNSFTKTINIEGTPQNNYIFGSIFDLQRIQDSSLYNPTQKAPFELYINSELIEKGYVKLDSITQANHKVTYNVTLYGGLGGFFYNLSYAPDSSEKKTLASLQYITEESNEPNLDFVINKETVYEAWNDLMLKTATDEKWKVINFAPCYNGIPSDFGADKALINNNGYNHSIYNNLYYDGTKTFSSIYHGVQNTSGYSLAQFSEPMTCDETFDLRSYLQRPVVSVNRTLKAIFQPENNGGYQVKLDDHFFHWDNPYWNEKAWVTLPMLRTISEGGGAESSETITGATLENLNSRLWEVDFETHSLSKLSNTRMKVNISWTPSSTMSQSRVYDNRILNVSTGAHLFHGNTYVKKLFNSNGVIMQLWAMDINGNIVAQSDAYLLGSNQYQADSSIPLWDGFCAPREIPDIQPQQYKWIRGQWLKSGNGYDFCDDAGNAIGLSFSLNTSVEYTNLVMKIKLPTSDYVKFAYRGETPHYEDNIYGQTAGPYENKFPLYTTANGSANGDYTYVQAMDVNRVWGTLSYDIVDFETTAVDYEGFFSDTVITKDKLLSTPYTPADFLISYCKMFGLYFYRDPSEEADDPVACPNGVIHIMDRDTFFVDEYEDIEKLIDRGKDMTITPAMASTKWYEFKQEPVESAAEKDYEDTYGYTYGRQLVNTNYDFDSNTTQLYDGNVFKSGLMVREKDKYFVLPVEGIRWATWNGCSYSLFAPNADGYETYQFDIPIEKPKEFAINTLGLPHYDLMPKLQCHGKDNDPVDGDGVLLFYGGEIPALGEGINSGTQGFSYWITDDVADMFDLNGGEPCWIMGNSEYVGGPNGDRIAIKMDSLPFFTRDMFNYLVQEGNVAHSWNFGKPMVTFVPNTYNTDGDNIYNNFWKDYIHDLYNENTKKLTCYVLFNNRPHPYALRKWYWFDNAIWRLNEIKDWNVADNAPVQCEFIKVQDVENYKLGETHQGGGTQITVVPQVVGKSGGVVTYTVIMEDCGPWYIRGEAIGGVDGQDNRYYIYPETTAGTGCVSTFSVTVPPTSASTPITWTAKFRNSFDENIGEPTFTQASSAETYLRISEFTAFGSGETMVMMGNSSSNVDISTLSGVSESDWFICLGKAIDPSSNIVWWRVLENSGTDRSTTAYLVGKKMDSDDIVSSNTITVTQIGPNSTYFAFFDDSVTAPATGNNITVSFYRLGMNLLTISASTTMEWCRVLQIVPNASPAYLVFMVDENSGSSRQATIQLSGLDLQGNEQHTYLNVSQEAGQSSGATVYFEFYNDEMEATAAGGYYAAYFYNTGMQNNTISASSNVNFCTVEYIFPSSNPPAIQFSITANEGSDYRLAIIELAGLDVNGTVHKTYLNVLQGAAGILVYPDREIILDYDAGDSETRQITANNNWTITINDL